MSASEAATMNLQSYGRILKANSSWNPTFKPSPSKQTQVSNKLSVRYVVIKPACVNTALIWHNSNLSSWSLALSPKKKDTCTDEKIFASLGFDFFRVQLKCAFRIRPLERVYRSVVSRKTRVLLETKLEIQSDVEEEETSQRPYMPVRFWLEDWRKEIRRLKADWI